MTSYSIDELKTAMNQGIIGINKQVGHIYVQYNCSFFDNLSPELLNKGPDYLFACIATQINMNKHTRMDPKACQREADELFDKMSHLSSQLKELRSSLYIQFNKSTHQAIILVSNVQRKWLEMEAIYAADRFYLKQLNLAVRLVLGPIPSEFDPHILAQESIFKNSIKLDTAQRVGENLIVELIDKNVYERCIADKVFQMKHKGSRLILTMQPYQALENPDGVEFNVENWYGTEMLQYTDRKVDIGQFEQKNIIFRLKWNPELWLDEYEKAKRNRNSYDGKEKKRCDGILHMLRVTAMANTLAILRERKYETFDQNKVQVKLESSPITTIVYKHESKLDSFCERSLPLQTPFKSTSVRVINKDCLKTYEKLTSEGKNPILLNMANAYTPGGGYRKGDGAQEENIFRRSNYCISLDPLLDTQLSQKSNSKTYYCDSRGKQKEMREGESMYPIEEYGAIYTKGITVFRDTEEKGYRLLSQPMYDVSAIALAAYRDPDITKENYLTKKFAVGTRKKIENLFTIAFLNGHDTLVLSAFGCGAFKNPPEHIASIFKSVILQFAGYFREIVFSIIDDHNTGNYLNPHGNLAPFQKILDKFVSSPPSNQLSGMTIGPYHIAEVKNNRKAEINDVIIGKIPPCDYAGRCNRLNDQQHIRDFSHPCKCPLEPDCTETKDAVHLAFFLHRQNCPDGGQCVNSDKNHWKDLNHPEFCSDEGHCTNMESQHLNQYRHVPLCEYGIECDLLLRKSTTHTQEFRHCRKICPFGGNCVNFHDQKHIRNEIHPFRTPCPLTPYSCELHVHYLQKTENSNAREFKAAENHCLRYSHICPHGRQCTDFTESHVEVSIHIAREMCQKGSHCDELMNDEHLNAFTHPSIRDIRYRCRNAATECKDIDKSAHVKRFRHVHTIDPFGATNCANLNQDRNFVQNQAEAISNIQRYVEKKLNKKWTSIHVPSEVLNWARSLRPIHRCSPAIFESILVHGHVMSRGHMDDLKNSKFVSETVGQHKRVRKILKNHVNATQERVRSFINTIVKLEFKKTYAGGADADPNTEEEKLDHRARRDEQALKLIFDSSDVDEIKLCATEIAKASFQLNSNKTGIGFTFDKDLGTDKHVFGILGPHTGVYYGDIIIIFKRELMQHPDANFSPLAATTFKSGKAFTFHPWLTDSGSDSVRIEQFHASKLHCSNPGYEQAAALILMAMAGLQGHIMNENLESIIKRWLELDSHQVFEAHLPKLIPLHYVEHIYIPQNVFEKLSASAQQNAKKLFGRSLTVAKYNVDCDAAPTAFGKPDPSRVNYEKYYLTEILSQIKLNPVSPDLLLSYGTTITLSPSHFGNQATIPITISQAYKNIRNIGNLNASDESVYIYFKVITNGDFMLTLTDQPIKPDEDQSHLKYLVCYVAPIPDDEDIDNYNEQYSYIGTYPPELNDTVIQAKKYKFASNVFHKGCNDDDAVLYCFRMDRKNGYVSLMHAGANSIYMHVRLEWKFRRDELNLNDLDYVHVSAGSQSVPIQNLIIQYGSLPHVHPTFDKHFNSTNSVQDSPSNGRNLTEPAKLIPKIEHPSKKEHRKDDQQSVRSKSSESPSFRRKAYDFIKGLIVPKNGKGHDNAKPGNKELDRPPEQSNPPRLQPRGTPQSKVDKPPRSQKNESSWSREKSESKSRSRSASRSRSDLRARPRGRSRYHEHESSKSRSRSASRSRPDFRAQSSGRSKHDEHGSSRHRSPSGSHESSRPQAREPPRLTPCRDSVNCQEQYGSNKVPHCQKYSHPCRFSDVCRNQFDRTHSYQYTHVPLSIKRCQYDKDCKQLDDPLHRCAFRHTNLPDYLYPCQYQKECRTINQFEHRIKYSHGEILPVPKKN